MSGYFVVTSGTGGTRIEGPLTREIVAERLRDGSGGEPGVTYYGYSPSLLSAVPEQGGGRFMAREGSVLVIRGEVVTREELTLCPCGSGKAFADCHGAAT